MSKSINTPFLILRYGLFAVCMMCTLSSCGNKGDLYLPENGSATEHKSTLKKKS